MKQLKKKTQKKIAINYIDLTITKGHTPVDTHGATFIPTPPTTRTQKFLKRRQAQQKTIVDTHDAAFMPTPTTTRTQKPPKRRQVQQKNIVNIILLSPSRQRNETCKIITKIIVKE